MELAIYELWHNKKLILDFINEQIVRNWLNNVQKVIKQVINTFRVNVNDIYFHHLPNRLLNTSAHTYCIVLVRSFNLMTYYNIHYNRISNRLLILWKIAHIHTYKIYIYIHTGTFKVLQKVLVFIIWSHYSLIVSHLWLRLELLVMEKVMTQISNNSRD